MLWACDYVFIGMILKRFQAHTMLRVEPGLSRG